MCDDCPFVIAVVYFNQQTGASHTIRSLKSCSNTNYFSVCRRLNWKRFEMNKKGWERLKKLVWPVFGCTQHPNAGQNSQQVILHLPENFLFDSPKNIYLNSILSVTWICCEEWHWLFFHFLKKCFRKTFILEESKGKNLKKTEFPFGLGVISIDFELYLYFTQSPNFELCGWLFFLTIFEKIIQLIKNYDKLYLHQATKKYF